MNQSVLPIDRLTSQQRYDHFERFIQTITLCRRIDPQFGCIVNQRAGPYAEHRPPARHVIQLHHAVGNDKGMVIRQRNNTRTQPDVARPLSQGGNEHGRVGNVLETTGMMFTNPGLVIVEFVEMRDEIHVPFKRQSWIFIRHMEWGEEKHLFARSGSS